MPTESRKLATRAKKAKSAAPRTRVRAPRPQASRKHFVEVLSPGTRIDSIEDRKLRFTRRVLFLARRWRHLMDEALRGTGHSHARWITLIWVDLLDGKANHRELAERVDVELPTLVRLLNRLEQEGLVARRSLGSKGSAKSVVLTPRGRERLDAMSDVVNRTREGFLDNLDEAQLTQGLEALDALLAQYATVLDWRGSPRRVRRG
jgi:MarR family transcriptional regulator, transcriptional regulator for hemolysin